MDRRRQESLCGRYAAHGREIREPVLPGGGVHAAGHASCVFGGALTRPRDHRNFVQVLRVALVEPNARHKKMPLLFYFPLIVWMGMLELAQDEMACRPKPECGGRARVNAGCIWVQAGS